jgi:glycosyltransferase involved in cell wall biosynthesis
MAAMEPSARPLSLSVCVTAFNEEEDLEITVREVIDVLSRHGVEYEVIIINDGSTDRTGEIARRLAQADPGVRIIEHPRNLNVGISIQEGMAAATKEFVTYIPGDYMFDLNRIENYFTAMHDHDLIVGYILNHEARERHRVIASQLFVKVIRLLYGIDVHYTNGLNFIRTELVRDMRFISLGHTISSEIIIKAMKFRQVRHCNQGFYLNRKVADTSTAFKLKSIRNAVYYTWLIWKDIVIGRKKF